MWLKRACNPRQQEHIMNIVTGEAAMTAGLQQASVRDERGRFVPGRSGNPAGKLPGTRNRATLLRAALDGEDGPAMARVIIDKAIAGDVVTARFCLDRLEPRPRSRAIAIDLPEGRRVSDIVAAYDATVEAMMNGEITPDEAVQVTHVLDGRLRALKAARPVDKQIEQCDIAKPSPPGRGLGEGIGVGRAFAGIGTVSSRRPHPDPLPQGEGMASRGDFHRESPALRLHSQASGAL